MKRRDLSAENQITKSNRQFSTIFWKFLKPEQITIKLIQCMFCRIPAYFRDEGYRTCFPAVPVSPLISIAKKNFFDKNHHFEDTFPVVSHKSYLFTLNFKAATPISLSCSQAQNFFSQKRSPFDFIEHMLRYFPKFQRTSKIKGGEDFWRTICVSVAS